MPEASLEPSAQGPHRTRAAMGAAARTGATLPIQPPDVLSRLASLKSMNAGELKSQWRKLFDHEPPPYNRRFLESRLAYRIQELAYGGLPAATVRRLEVLGEQLDGGKISRRKRNAQHDRPIAGTRLIRQWQGVEHSVIVGRDGFDWEGRPYNSLSAIACAITGTRWNGLVFFGLKNQKRRPERQVDDTPRSAAVYP